MDKKFLYAMAQFDEETEKKLKKLQNSILSPNITGSQTPNIPNHITLGTFNTDKESIIKEKIKQVSKGTTKIYVSFDNIGLFGMDVLFISPSTSYELLNLRKEFEDECVNLFNWVPHVTMLIDKNENIQKAIPILAEKFTPFSGYIESISLYEFYPNRFIAKEKLF